MWGSGIDEALQLELSHDLGAGFQLGDSAFYHENSIGSTRQLTDAVGKDIERFEFDFKGEQRLNLVTVESLAMGTWTTISVVTGSDGPRTFLTDAVASFPTGKLVGNALDPDTNDLGTGTFSIIANDETTVSVFGDLTAVVQVGDVYRVERIERDPALFSPATFNHTGWQGRYNDWETGFYYFRNRHYDPETGRFLQRDPIGTFIDVTNVGNAFSFAGNNWVSQSDPRGLQDEENENEENTEVIESGDQIILGEGSQISGEAAQVMVGEGAQASWGERTEVTASGEPTSAIPAETSVDPEPRESEALRAVIVGVHGEEFEVKLPGSEEWQVGTAGMVLPVGTCVAICFDTEVDLYLTGHGVKPFEGDFTDPQTGGIITLEELSEVEVGPQLLDPCGFKTRVDVEYGDLELPPESDWKYHRRNPREFHWDGDFFSRRGGYERWFDGPPGPVESILGWLLGAR